MGGTQASAAPDGAIGEADRRALAELLARHVPSPVAVEGAVTELLAAGWRPPAPALTTVEELDACRPGAVVTDRDGEPWIRNAADQWCQAERVGIHPGALLEWAPLTRHTDGGHPSGVWRAPS